MLIRPLLPEDREQALAAHGELAAEGFDFLLGYDDGDDWDAYLTLLADQELGERLGPRQVPHTFRVAVADGALVGRVSVRHALTGHLAVIGGHVGYAVRPGARRRGHAGRLLRSALDVAAGLGLSEVLVTCDDDNAASIRTIEAAGGLLEDTIDIMPGAAKRRYWIKTRS